MKQTKSSTWRLGYGHIHSYTILRHHSIILFKAYYTSSNSGMMQLIMSLAKAYLVKKFLQMPLDPDSLDEPMVDKTNTVFMSYSWVTLEDYILGARS